MIVTLIGPPGAGKSTQAKKLAEKFGVPHVSTGEMLREFASGYAPACRDLKEIMDRGGLVPDSVIIGLLRLRLEEPDCHGGYVLDGFPRTPAQALQHYSLGWDSYVVLLDVPEEVVLKRIAGRNEGRTDDGESTAKARLREYEETSRQVVEFYESKGLFCRVSIGEEETPDAVFVAIVKSIEETALEVLESLKVKYGV